MTDPTLPATDDAVVAAARHLLLEQAGLDDGHLARVLASIHTHEGNMTQARHYFNLVLEQARLALDDDPRNAWRRCDLAQAMLVLGHQEDALRELRTVIYQNPERSVLETVRSGLSFLAESPESIDGLEALIRLLDETLQARDSGTLPAPDQGAGT